MSDTPQQDVENETDEPLAGLRLAAARRAQGISVLDIAKELHLDEPKVRALEDNQFDVLGAPVFAKGHLRKYAELVGVSTDDIMADYYLLNRAVGAPPVVGAPRKQQRDYQLGRWLAGAAIVAGVAVVATAGYWWLQHREAGPVAQVESTLLAPFVSTDETVSEDSEASGPRIESDENDDPVAIQMGDDTLGDNVRAPSITSNNDSTPTSASPPPAPPQASLTMTFSGDCWTEVSDASGTRLYFDLGSAGDNITVTGEAPLRALFGDSANVRVALNGQDFVIPESMRNGRTARLTVNAP